MRRPELTPFLAFGACAMALGCTAQAAPLDMRAKPPVPNPIKHIIIIMQENRSFDTYFGTFPGANGFPKNTCVPLDPAKPNQGCVEPFHNRNDVNAGGPHAARNAQDDANDGITKAAMNGFVHEQTVGLNTLCKSNDKHAPASPRCALFVPGSNAHDVMRQITHEITVKSIAGVITHREHKGLCSLSIPIEVTSVKDELVKYGDHGNRVIVRTYSTIWSTTQRICHVRLMIRRVEIYSIPARGKVDLRPNSIGAVYRREPR